MNTLMITDSVRSAPHKLANVLHVVMARRRSRPRHKNFANLDGLNDHLLADIGLAREPVTEPLVAGRQARSTIIDGS